MAPVIRECERRGQDYSIIHTGQHYSYEMDRIFFEQLELPQPDHNLDVDSGSHGEQTGRIMAGVESVLMADKPEVVLVQGDTNTVMAGALAAAKLHIKVGHVEAGLRSYDRSMPEEINRVVADHISDYCFAPTEVSKVNLLKEGIAEEKIHVTGNTIVDSVYQNLKIAMRKVNVLADLGLQPREYFLVTAHRQENVDSRERLGEIIRAWRWSELSSACLWSSRFIPGPGRWSRASVFSLMAFGPLSRSGSWSFCSWRRVPVWC